MSIKVKNKLIVVGLLVGVSCTMFFLSCNSYSGSDNPISSETTEIVTSENDADFLVNTAEFYLQEIELCRIAQRKAGNSEVKELAREIEQSRTKSFIKLRDLAEKKLVSVPLIIPYPVSDKWEIEAKKGPAFDKEYFVVTVEGNKRSIKEFERVANQSADNDVKNWATNSLPMLKENLRMVLNCQRKAEEKLMKNKQVKI